jgi:hypothetical protein
MANKTVNKTRYSRDARKHIVSLIENLKNDKDYENIFEILTDDSSGQNSYTQNSNGVFLNLSTISDNVLDKVTAYLNKVAKRVEEEKDESDEDIPLVPATRTTDRTYKLSNYEKNIIKQRNLKKVLNEDNDYEELSFNTTPSVI